MKMYSLASPHAHKIKNSCFIGSHSCLGDVHTVLSEEYSTPHHGDGVWSSENISDDSCYEYSVMNNI